MIHSFSFSYCEYNCSLQLPVFHTRVYSHCLPIGTAGVQLVVVSEEKKQTNFSFFVQLRPLYELVKEVNCAGVKKLHLKRAIEEYLSQEDSCRCRPCQNNGQLLLVDSVCYCSCRDGTSGAACQTSAVARDPAGTAQFSFSQSSD